MSQLVYVLLAAGSIVDPSAVRVVHLVQSNHLDVGFADYAENIMNRYLRGGPGTLGPPHRRNESVYDASFLLSAASTAETLRARGGSHGMRYMAQAYVVSYFFDCAGAERVPFPSPSAQPQMRCPNGTERATLERAIRRGDVYWHAFPHNAEPELMDASLFAAALNFSADLAARFERPRPTVLSLRDVPGLSRGVVPLLAASGVVGITIGVNDGSPPPLVPSVSACYAAGGHEVRSPFRWRDDASGDEVVVDIHPGGYGGVLPLIPSTTTPYYSRDGVLCDCVGVRGLDEVLCYAWKGDNYGPAGVNETDATFEVFARAFPNASTVKASTPDAWFALVASNATLRGTLPVLTAEIGDTWIYGAASDPLKLAMMRAMMRERTACVAALRCGPAEEPHLEEFTRLLLKLPEHTWGGCGCAHMDLAMPTTAWSAAALRAARADQSPRRDPFYDAMEKTWDEQRAFVFAALDALELGGARSALAATLRAELATLRAAPPSAARAAALGYSALPSAQWAQPHALGGFVVGFDHLSGALTTLRDARSNATWASAAQPALRFAYRSHAYAEAVQYKRAYTYAHGGAFPYAAPFAWPWVGMNGTVTVARTWHGKIVGLWVRRGAAAQRAAGGATGGAAGGAAVVDRADSILLELELPAELLQSGYGAPTRVWLNLTAPADGGSAASESKSDAAARRLDIEIAWANKSATRLLESMWLEMRPALPPVPLRPTVRAAQRAQPTKVTNRSRSRGRALEGGLEESREAAAGALPGWRILLDKLGSVVDAQAVVAQGGGALHGIAPGGGVTLAAARSGSAPVGGAAAQRAFSATSRDAGLVAPGASGLSPINFTAFDHAAPRAEDGFAFLLFNNLYEVNYPMYFPWKEKDATSRFRFSLRVK